MTTFESLHRDQVLGSLTTFDRMILRGYLTAFFPEGAFHRFLLRQGVLLKNFNAYVEKKTQQLKTHLLDLAAKANRPYIYLQKAHTHASGESKEDLAREIANRDGIEEGLVCIFGVVEPCSSFSVRGNRKTHKLEVVRKRRKCLHFYLYQIDPEFGWMHLRIQSWFPFTIQVYVNGREWLARRLDELGIGYRRYKNCFLEIDDLETAQKLCERLHHRSLAGILNRWARLLNPHCELISRLGFGAYYWVIDQCEGATDIMFRSRKALESILPDLLDHATRLFSCEDVLRFLGRKLHGNFTGKVTTSMKKRREGVRVKHSMRRNSIKIYDKHSVLRVETTINNPREFKVLRVKETPEGSKRRWLPMGKGIANLWRFAQVVRQSNVRYLEALANVEEKGEAIRQLDGLCRCRTVRGRRVPRLNPVASPDLHAFRAVLAGDHLITGFRNRDLAERLQPLKRPDPVERSRRCARISRLIAKLRGHGLVAKVKDSHLYRITAKGHRFMAAAVSFHDVGMPRLLMAAPSA